MSEPFVKDQAHRERIEKGEAILPSYPVTKELVDAALRHADGLTALLAKSDWKPGRAHIEQARNSIKKLADMLGTAQCSQERGDLTKIAAECHRAKWQFDFNDEIKIGMPVARRALVKAFEELHRIGDLALKLRDASPVPSTPRICPDCGRDVDGPTHAAYCPVSSTNGNTP